MKRDMELIRLLMLEIEEHASYEKPIYAHDFLVKPDRAKRWTLPVVSEHMRLLSEAGFIEIDDCRSLDGSVDDVYCDRLSWNGHEFIAGIRNDKVWTSVKKSLHTLGAGATAGLIKALAQRAAEEMLGL